MPKTSRNGNDTGLPVSKGGGSAPLEHPGSSLARRALQVLICWNAQSLQAENAALEEKPSAEHVYTLFYNRRGFEIENTCPRVIAAHMTAEAANNAALAAFGLGHSDREDDYRKYDRVGHVTAFLPSLGRYKEDFTSGQVLTVTRQRLHGTIPSAAPLDAASARALHVAAGAPRSAAAAMRASLELRSNRVNPVIFAVMNYYLVDAEDSGCLTSVWRTKAEAKQEAARRLAEDLDWRRMRQAIRCGHYVPGQSVPRDSNLSDDGSESDGALEEDVRGNYFHTYYDIHAVRPVKLIA
ncbi:hypothetical protein JKP88DRAFT_324999 [Tribonema minus]|uniref:Uncharacterized protein n=1 Tax=Tribonema minus TaxID=303371 RepID=A0A835YS50_9STRA|nr:hypothetical protein JKP88DRAFT_324999 [Tribonema minus]